MPVHFYQGNRLFLKNKVAESFKMLSKLLKVNQTLRELSQILREFSTFLHSFEGKGQLRIFTVEDIQCMFTSSGKHVLQKHMPQAP